MPKARDTVSAGRYVRVSTSGSTSAIARSVLLSTNNPVLRSTGSPPNTAAHRFAHTCATQLANCGEISACMVNLCSRIPSPGSNSVPRSLTRPTPYRYQRTPPCGS
jgi:hypothetical protein